MYHIFLNLQIWCILGLFWIILITAVCHLTRSKT
jgi:hypothetical protein